MGSTRGKNYWYALSKVILSMVIAVLIFYPRVALAEEKQPEVIYVEAEYDSIEQIWFGSELNSRYFSVAKDGKYGIIDLNGQLVAPCIHETSDVDNLEIDGKHGMFLEDGTYLEPRSEEPLHFEHGYSRIVVDKKYGVIDREGKTILEPKYLDCFIYGENQFAVQIIDRDGYELWGIVDSEGKDILRPGYTNLGLMELPLT